eukprot:scaffold112213_cov44-Cyclotella_meneghiniana.AAC.5
MQKANEDVATTLDDDAEMPDADGTVAAKTNITDFIAKTTIKLFGRGQKPDPAARKEWCRTQQKLKAFREEWKQFNEPPRRGHLGPSQASNRRRKSNKTRPLPKTTTTAPPSKVNKAQQEDPKAEASEEARPIIAYSRPKNIGNYVTEAKLHQAPGYTSCIIMGRHRDGLDPL